MHIFSDDSLVRVPVGPQSNLWRTGQFTKVVLICIRTATTLIRLLDIADCLLADPRIQVVFTICGQRSAFARNLEREIIGCGCVLIPWEQARDMTFDLAISSSLNGSLEDVQAPLLLLAHGPGHTKSLSVPTNDSPSWQKLKEPGRFRRLLALTCEEERGLLDTGAIEKAVVGDVVFDSLLAAWERRETLRRDLGVNERKLVVLSSTWGRHSSFAKMPSLADELLRSLPCDEYAVASILHPNVWVGHGEWQVRSWHRDALAAGLILAPFRNGWQAPLVSADCFLGDHGSVSIYAGMLGLRCAKLSTGSDEALRSFTAVSSTMDAPVAESAADALRFITSDDGRGRLADLPAVRERAFANLGKSAEVLRGLIYDLLELEKPRHALVPIPIETPKPAGAVCSFYATSNNESPGNISLFPASTGKPDNANTTLVSTPAERNYAILQTCEVVLLGKSGCLDSWKHLAPLARFALVGYDKAYRAVNGNGAEIAQIALTCDEAPREAAVAKAVLMLLDEGVCEGSFSCGGTTFSLSMRPSSPTPRGF